MKILVTLLAMLIMIFENSFVMAQEGYYKLSEVRDQASEGWHESYEDKYGRKMSVDIEVQVFGSDEAPVLQVGFPEYVEYDKEENGPYRSVTDAKKRGGKSQYIYELLNGTTVEMDKIYGEEYGNEITLREAYEIFEGDLIQRGKTLEDYQYEQPDELIVVCSVKEATKEIVAPAFYMLSLWSKMYELPIMAHVGSSFKDRDSPHYVPNAMMDIRNSEEYHITDRSFVIQEVLAEDIPLCSLKKVIHSIEEKIKSGHIQEVYSLRFGYSVYNDPRIQSTKPVSAYDAKCYYLVPSWILKCKFVTNPKKDIDDRPVWTITINAQTGIMVDPFDTSKKGLGDSAYPGYISWKEIK